MRVLTSLLAFVKQGIPPIKVVRRLMLPKDTSSVL